MGRFPGNSRIRDISRNSGAGDTSDVGRSRRKCPYFHCTRVSVDSVNPISIFVESLLGVLKPSLLYLLREGTISPLVDPHNVPILLLRLLLQIDQLLPGRDGAAIASHSGLPALLCLKQGKNINLRSLWNLTVVDWITLACRGRGRGRRWAWRWPSSGAAGRARTGS